MHPRARRRGPAASRMLAGSIVAVTLVIGAASGLTVMQMRRSAWEQVGRVSQNLLEAVEHMVDRNIEFYDLSIRAVVDGLQNPAIDESPPELRQLALFDRAATANGLGAILALDPQGQAFADSASAVPRAQAYPSADFFLVHKQREDVGLYIGKPFRMAPDGRWVIPLSRRLAYADGAFAGVVMGTIDIGYFNGLFARLSIGDQSRIAFFRESGELLVRSPVVESMIGQNLSFLAHFRRFFEGNAGQFVATGHPDGVEALFTYCRVGHHPLVATAVVPTEVITALWRPKAVAIGVLVAILCGGMIALTLRLQRELERRSRAETLALDANRDLARLAHTDGLTGLPNRRHFDEAFARAQEQDMGRGQAPRRATFSLVLLDADRFKVYNDTYGHLAGDEVLRTVARVLQRQIRGPAEIACRIGGEEFAVLLPGVSRAEAVARAERIRLAVARLLIPHAGNEGGGVTVSLGVAEAGPGESGGRCFAAADAALYEAKRRGRNRVMAAPADDATSAQVA
ncbi:MULTISPECIES: GGDEF domain-containing protein [Methylobacterium]|uniref:diguanylate cyclase n=2 Tax=Methylobacterium TaxID=407 RepID=A0A0C6F5V7_9HYPH|nr:MULTISPECIES: sensor domain-containing diguanylate cyclase [Methylobacterium]BAQ43693.1 response regulator containing a CheY-like receiver domain and a GGDEF domain [Methylobacterium aquaticum]